MSVASSPDVMAPDRSQLRAVGGTPPPSAELGETLDRALESGTRLLENRARLLALDLRAELRLASRRGVLLGTAALFGALGWISLMLMAGAFLSHWLTIESVFGVLFALHAILATGILLFARAAHRRGRRPA